MAFNGIMCILILIKIWPAALELKDADGPDSRTDMSIPTCVILLHAVQSTRNKLRPLLHRSLLSSTSVFAD
jgi:hypothetical protein